VRVAALAHDPLATDHHVADRRVVAGEDPGVEQRIAAAAEAEAAHETTIAGVHETIEAAQHRETTLVADPDGPVPVSFGFHPYVGLPELPRAEWRLTLPAMRRLVLDRRGIPTGEEEAFGGLDARLDGLDLDDGFAVLEERTSLSVAGGGRRIIVEFLAGYRYAQIFAPKDKAYVALEPMTAPTNALTSGRGLRLVDRSSRNRTLNCRETAFITSSGVTRP